ncbi:hypothetical protein SKAU_G00363750 [Synaphobranchus kaupii]|uniref:Uncharacterized protein n=1 Tax=Synaphobranchus kaupii TaxID=118154 RepID=A0A9Q1EIR5_SYNKA|nr:hypothetical protein SKAU_G00363750 [Synaphobranchus kaupii]
MSFATPDMKRNDLTLADNVKVIQMLDGVLKMSQAEIAKKFRCSLLQSQKEQGRHPPTMESEQQPKPKEGARTVKLRTLFFCGLLKERKNIVFKTAHGEKKDDDTQVYYGLGKRLPMLPTIIQVYEPDCIYNCDETGDCDLYRAQPNETLTLKTEKIANEQLQAAFHVIGDWMQIHDFTDYSNFTIIKRHLHQSKTEEAQSLLMLLMALLTMVLLLGSGRSSGFCSGVNLKRVLSGRPFYSRTAGVISGAHLTGKSGAARKLDLRFSAPPSPALAGDDAYDLLTDPAVEIQLALSPTPSGPPLSRHSRAAFVHFS